MQPSVNPGGYETSIDNMARRNAGMTYRQFLQYVADNVPNTTQGKEAAAILAVTGDDGVVNPAFIADPYAYTGTDYGQVGEGYGPQGVQRVNSIFWNAYQQANPTPAGAGAGGGGTVQIDPDAAARNELRGRITSRGSEIDAAYDALFGDLNTLVQSRSSELDKDYSEQLKKAGDQFAAYLPKIESSYSALGAANSTDLRDANIDAKSGFEDTTKTIGRNKEKDQSALGQFKTESEARFGADRDAARRAVEQAGSTTDVGALRSMANDLDTNLSQTGVTRATLGTEGTARQQILGATKDGGRAQEAMNALDSILKSSMSGDVKAAAVEAITNAGGLSDEEKKRVQEQYGNVYAEQASL